MVQMYWAQTKYLLGSNKVLTFFLKYDIHIENVYVIDYLVILHIKFMKWGSYRKNVDGLKYIHFFDATKKIKKEILNGIRRKEEI